jgi:S-disulfanyl-L-cysteine oxidoreductase SoxD
LPERGALVAVAVGFALVGGLVLVLGLDSCGAPARDSDSESDGAGRRTAETTAPGPAADAEAQRVDLHSDWKRWADTPRLREQALEKLKDVPKLGLGREATPAEIAAVDIDVEPDGTGLPEGSGTVARGRVLYQSQCVQCHGAEGKGADNEALAGREPREGFPFAEQPKLRQTVGNYWPYATTLYDYIHRAMPQAVPGSLPPDDVYSLVAYILYLNEVVPEDETLDRESLPRIEMPARDRFVYDDRRGGAELR